MVSEHVVVVGGGVSGLVTAFHLAGTGHRVTLLEGDDRLGGRIAAADVAGVAVDTGPDAVLVRMPAAAALIRDLGLTDRLRPPGGGGAWLWRRGALRPLPAGSVFGVPDRLWPLLRDGLVGPWGFVRAGADLVLPRRPLDGDPTIEQVLRPRFGRQVFERLVEPMLGGVHAGRAGRLSARSAAAEVMALAAGRRSLYLALRRRGPRSGGPALQSFAGGLTELVEALRAAAVVRGAAVATGARVESVTSTGSGWRVAGTGFAQLDAADVVLATPAPVTAGLLRPLAPSAADALDGIEYVGVATVTLAYPRAAAAGLPPGTGFLVPPVEGRLLVGCSWLTAKWPHLAERAGDVVLVRGMVGRDGDQGWAALDDDALVAAVRRDLASATGLTGAPLAVHVRRMPAAMPQYTVGHADRLAAVDAALADLPGVHVTGAAYRGVGIAGCVAQAAAVAAAVTARHLHEEPAAR